MAIEPTFTSESHCSQLRSKIVERIGHPELLALFPVFPLQFLGPDGSLVPIGNPRIAHALGQGLQREDPEPLDPVIGDQRRIAGDMAQIFDDNAGIVDGSPVIGYQHWNFAERGLGDQRSIGRSTATPSSLPISPYRRSPPRVRNQAHAHEGRYDVPVDLHSELSKLSSGL